MQIYYTELKSNNIDKITSHRLLAASLVRYWKSSSAGLGDQPAPDLMGMARKLVSEMRVGEFGKPTFVVPETSDFNYPIPHFSISHSGNAWAVLFSQEECGLDIQFQVDCKYDRLASRIYGKEEAELIASLAGDEKIQEFFRHWTCREAYIKALGISVFRDAEAEGMNCKGVSESKDGRRWKVYNIELPMKLYAAVCVTL